jgi:hypothetical protein
MCSIAFPPESTTNSSLTPKSETTDHEQLTTDRATRNKRNAQHSTGPRTKAGKARSAQNAKTHGLSSALPPTEVPVPDPTAQLAYTTLQQELKEEHRPTTPTQTVLVEELALVIWKLQYLPRVEHRLFNTPLNCPETPQPDPAHLTLHPRLDNEADPTAAILALHLMQDRPTPLTRLQSLHHRLQSRLNSILNQLRYLRKDQQLHNQRDAELQRAQRNAQTDRILTQRAIDEKNHREMDEAIEVTKRNIEQRQREQRAAFAQPAMASQSLAVSRTNSPTPSKTCQSAPAQNEPTQRSLNSQSAIPNPQSEPPKPQG